MTRKQVKLDRINQKILMVLQHEAKISNLELAERVNLSPSACLHRVKALEEAGIIKEYLTHADIDAVCHNVKAYMLVTLKSNDYESCCRFEQMAKQRSEVIDCMRVNGEIDHIALVMCSRIEEFNRFCDELLRSDAGIEKLNTHFIISTPKWFGGYPLDKLEWKD